MPEEMDTLGGEGFGWGHSRVCGEAGREPVSGVLSLDQV